MKYHIWVQNDEDTDERFSNEFANEELYNAAQYLAEVIGGMVTDERVEITASQDRSRLLFRIQFADPDNNSLFIGPRFRVVNAILEIMRFQQYVKHNRYIEFELVQPDGRTQRVVNKRVFDNARSDVVEQVIAHLTKSLNIGSERGQLTSLRSAKKMIDKILEQENTDG